MKELKSFKTICCVLVLTIVMVILLNACIAVKVNKEGDSISTLLPAYCYENKQKLWGLVNVKGKFVIQPQYEAIELIKGTNLMRFIKNSKHGIMDKDGKIIVEPIYYYLSDYSDDMIIGFDGSYYCAIDDKGQIAFKTRDYIGSFQDNIAWLQTLDNSNNHLYGYVDKKGRTVIPPQYTYAGDFNNGKAIVKTMDDKYTIIDKNGRILYESSDKVLNDLSEETVVFYDKGKNLFGYISISGEIIKDAEFRYAGKFENGMAIVAITNNGWEQKFGIINKNGNFIVEPQYSMINRIGENMFSVSLKSLAGVFDMFSSKAVIDGKGSVITDFSYYDIGYYKDSVVSVCDGKSTFFIDKKGKTVKNVPDIEGAGTMTLVGGLVRAEIDEDVLYYNKDGSTVWKPDNIIKLDSGIEVNIKKFRPDRCMLVKYPELSKLPDKKVQDSLNSALKLYFIGDHAESEQVDEMYVEDITVGFSVDENDDLLIIQMDAYIYPIGAAHGQPYRQNLHINIQNGNLYFLEDMFIKDSDYLKMLTDIINTKIKEENKKDELTYSVENIDLISSEQSFIATEDALVIYFQPYDIASYAEGFPTFVIPYEQIINLINIDSEFWKSFKK